MTHQRRFVFFTLIALLFTSFTRAQVGIGTTTPDNSAALEIKSTNQGLLVPRMDSTSRKSITSPANGLLVFDNSTSSFWYYQNSQWTELKVAAELEDADGDTRVIVESNPDDDLIHFVEQDTVRWRINNYTLESMNPGSSIFIGKNAGILDDRSNNNNVFMGDNSGPFNTDGDYNTFVGSEAGYYNTTGHENSYFGRQAGFSSISGEDNSFFGEKTGYSTTSGYYNSFYGASAGYYNVSGYQNAFFGLNSGYKNTIGCNNTAVGYHANSLDTANYNSTGIGFNAQCTGLNQVRIGNSSVTSIGGYANWTNVSDGRFKRNVSEDVKGLNFIMKLRPVTYNLDLHAIDAFFTEKYNFQDTSKWPERYEKENARQTGFIAQEVVQAAEESGYSFSGVDAPDNDRDFYGLRYAEFVVPLVKAVQEQQAIIQAQQEKLDTQEQTLVQLKAENQELKVLRQRIENLELQARQNN